MPILVDTSIWIDYFKGGVQSQKLDDCIDANNIIINDIILAELLPYLALKKQSQVISLLQSIQKIPLHIDWNEIIQFQTTCLQSGVNGVGIPDLIIAQHAKQHHCSIYSLDKHFRLLHEILNIDIYT